MHFNNETKIAFTKTVYFFIDCIIVLDVAREIKIKTSGYNANCFSAFRTTIAKKSVS